MNHACGMYLGCVSFDPLATGHRLRQPVVRPFSHVWCPPVRKVGCADGRGCCSEFTTLLWRGLTTSTCWKSAAAFGAREARNG